MRLQEYWGVGPKTAELLREELGAEAAVEAIESADVRTLTEAGLSRGRATRILRRAHGEAGMDVLATGDAREVYKEILDLAAEYAVTRHAADRIRVLTPLEDREAMESRLEDVSLATDTWVELDDGTREAVLSAFEEYDSVAGGERAAVEAALALVEAGATDGTFAPLADLETDRLREAVDALAGLGENGVAVGVDDRLDELRERLAAVEELAATPTATANELQEGVRGTDDFEVTLRRHLIDETGVDAARVREAMPADAADATDFVGATLRTLVDDLQSAVEERETEVRADLETTLESAREEVDRAIAVVDEVSLEVSLARFAEAFDLTSPTFVDADVVAVENARNLGLAGAGGTVQPVTYAVGDHDLPGGLDVPDGDRVAVLTGANSGGKTTLLETLAQVVLLAHMGLPVPADRAQVGLVDRLVFHRRHASFNAGVLESTLQSIVPPLSGEDHALMLVDEFEAITEPGRAADLLHGLVQLTVDQAALGVFVTHLADDLAPLPDRARTDGIFAQGLDRDLQLEVDYQPRFDTVGKSTPEFIVSRLLANADDPTERVGFEALAEAIGETAVQRTLADARWAGN